MKSVEYDILTADNADDMTAKVNAARAGGWRRCCDLAVTPLGMLVQQVFRFAGDHPGVRGESKLICARSADELTLQENRLVGQGWDLIPSLKAGADGALYVWMERADNEQPSGMEMRYQIEYPPESTVLSAYSILRGNTRCFLPFPVVN